jgi:hypothetical protein
MLAFIAEALASGIIEKSSHAPAPVCHFCKNRVYCRV